MDKETISKIFNRPVVIGPVLIPVAVIGGASILMLSRHGKKFKSAMRQKQFSLSLSLARWRNQASAISWRVARGDGGGKGRVRGRDAGLLSFVVKSNPLWCYRCPQEAGC